jgi:hypothetical protein
MKLQKDEKKHQNASENTQQKPTFEALRRGGSGVAGRLLERGETLRGGQGVLSVHRVEEARWRPWRRQERGRCRHEHHAVRQPVRPSP